MAPSWGSSKDPLLPCPLPGQHLPGSRLWEDGWLFLCGQEDTCMFWALFKSGIMGRGGDKRWSLHKDNGPQQVPS